ncbi:hypothetical protein OZN62_04935 [Aurantiacibacter sp. MUD11]|uniref:hypothetical protein n=1 Tax=Aurantiacibacter sp. MUD11 TaxID=3003265 RepID=UPI0022AA7D11|nr:hypothetical protein [Aurantiacibacter sp. MUD11]WAT18919.1 hypothetical protein OZN62_04935 [Aurantiacibacter sp. MUD11]
MAFAAQPASAQSMEELDRLSDLSADEESGIDAARDQAGRGEYLEALATLERVMAAHPRSLGARLLHAVYLCRIDDRQGGLVEIDAMDEDDFGEENLTEAREQCSRPYVEPQPAPALEAPATPAAGKPEPVAETPAAEGGDNAISGSNSVSSGASLPPRPDPEADGGEKD